MNYREKINMLKKFLLQLSVQQKIMNNKDGVRKSQKQEAKYLISQLKAGREINLEKFEKFFNKGEKNEK